MPSPNEPVKPTPFDVAQPAPVGESTAAATSTPKGTPAWVLPALGGLVLLAVAVIFWLPQRLDPAAPVTADQSADDRQAAHASTANKKPEAQTESTPWSDAQLARLRKEAQDVLQELLDVQFALEERGVQRWAPERFATAGALAVAADELYKNREFEQATELYQQGLVALQALQEALPETFNQLLEEARQAIEQGDVAAATVHLEMAALIDPDSAAVPQLQQRVAQLPQLLALLEQAAATEAAGDLDGAESLLRQATALDPLHQRAQEQLQRVAAAAQAQRFNAAMSEGYAALDANHFSKAREAFRSAAKIQAGSDEAASALLEVAAAETAHRLAALQRKGRQAEQSEQWQQAVEAYEEALKIDRSVLFASEGLQRCTVRAQMDKQINTTLAEPLRLSTTAVAEAAGRLLQQAKQITPRGPVLERQINSLETTLRQASIPVTVALLSDGETEVTVYKVARLGRFEQHELTLRPGTYTAVGSRNGYRDVRHNFTVRHDSKPTPLTIVCTEPI